MWVRRGRLEASVGDLGGDCIGRDLDIAWATLLQDVFEHFVEGVSPGVVGVGLNLVQEGERARELRGHG